MKLTIKQISITAIMLSICIASQFFKNTSVYITGPIINLCLIITTLTAGTFAGIILSIITPLTAAFITGNPLTLALPIVMVMIMIGNIILCVVVGIFKNKFRDHIIIPMVIGSILKAAFMGVTISLIILPNFIPIKLAPRLAVFQWTFSGVQLITALIASVVAAIIWIPLKKIIK